MSETTRSAVTGQPKSPPDSPPNQPPGGEQARRNALAQIRQLAQAAGVTLAEIEAALNDPDAGQATGPHPSRALVRVLSYIGGTFVFAGIATFIGLQWDGLNSAARVVITLGSGLAAFVLGVIALKDSRYQAAATPLLICAAALEPTGLLVAFDEFGSGGDWRIASMLTSACVGGQFGLAFVQFRRTVLALFAIAFGTGFCTLALDKLGMDAELIGLTAGGALLLLGVAVHRSTHAAISPLIFLTGSWGFLWALFEQVERGPLEILFLAAACGLVYLGVAVRSRTLNFTSTLAILIYTGYFTGKHFADSIGWPLALIAFGLIMIGISAVALRIDRKYLRNDGQS